MADINDFKVLKNKCIKMYDYFGKGEFCEANDKARMGFYHLVLENIAGINEIESIQECIIDTEYNDKEDTYIFTDLLADVLIYPDGKVKVVDIGEIAEAMEKGIIDDALVKKALVRLDKLLDIIYAPDGLKNAVGKYMDMER